MNKMQIVLLPISMNSKYGQWKQTVYKVSALIFQVQRETRIRKMSHTSKINISIVYTF